jgi:hypothetical protein
MMRKFAALSALLVLAACQQAGETAAPVASEAAATVEKEPSETATPDTGIDKSALSERKEPGRLLGYLAEAVNSGNWPDAALAWHTAEDGSPMTGPKLKALLGNPQEALLSFGPGRQEGAAGSLYYEAPILLIGGGGQKEGTITLRRVNDVDGAEDWQLAWHVERLEWKD